MVNKTLATAISSALLGGAVVFGVNPQTSDTAKAVILANNVEQSSRLLEAPTWDASIVSATEITDAYMIIAQKYGVTTTDITNAGGNIQAAIQVKLAEQGKLCQP